MALIAAGLIDVNGDLIDVVRSVTCAAEASVGAGTTTTDGGASRFIAETQAAAAGGYRIDMGAVTFDTSFTWVVRTIYRTPTTENGTALDDYHSLISRGGVFENNTQNAMGWRQSSIAPFAYQRNVGTLRGTEASGQPSLTPGDAYTILYRETAGNKQLYYCAQDIGGAGVDYVLVASATDAQGTDGSQHIWLGGPNTFTTNDVSIKAGILGALIYDHRVDDTELAAIALDGATGFYAQLPSGPSGPTIDTQPVADTVLINGDAARSSASFTVAATGTGTLSYQWELETSVGGGTYANVADGDGATWAGATTTNLTATFTVKTLTGRRVRCVVTDDNGSTTSSAVALTVYTGPVISKSSGTTNASGVDTLTCVSDYPNADGEFTVITATAGGVTKQVALHYETPP